MRCITIRGLTLGAGRTKIIVPLCEGEPGALLAAAAAAGESRADLAEWRVDALDGARDAAALAALAPAVRAALNGKPLLITCRTRGEGGGYTGNPAQYAALVRALCAGGAADLIDIELCAGEEIVRALGAEARARGVAAVVSSHDFSATPPVPEMTERLRRMEALGADMAKLAVMPRCRADAAALLEATALAAAQMQIPLITMSMGAAGAVTRVCGEAFGSAATFAALGRESAPGQPALDTALDLVSRLHACLGAAD
jgi:3-dehydroquinate dehydratase-1